MQPEARPRGLVLPPAVRPFRSYAVQVKVGAAGIGLDLATPIARRANLRVGGSFFRYDGTYDVDGLSFTGDLTFRSATAQLDIFPFGNGFRISPGVTAYNGNKITAATLTPGGQQFTLGDDTYVSSATDPVHGTGDLRFGNRVAPSLTFGFGNMLPRDGRHWSVPFEAGFQYIGDPKAEFTLAGTACDSMGDCGDIATEPQAQADLRQQIVDVNNDIHPLRFYPVVSTGVSYRFGR